MAFSLEEFTLLKFSGGEAGVGGTILDLRRSYKDGIEIPIYLPPSFPDVNILCDCGMFINPKKLTWYITIN